MPIHQKKLMSASIRKIRNRWGGGIPIIGTWESEVLGVGSNPGRTKGQKEYFEIMLKKAVSIDLTLLHIVTNGQVLCVINKCSTTKLTKCSWKITEAYNFCKKD